MDIENNKVRLVLTQARGKVRVADENGNHLKRPATEGKNLEEYYIEWMITNEEISLLAKTFLNGEDKKLIIERLSKIDFFMKGSEYAKRESLKTTTEKIDNISGFDVFRYTENFYSFERELDSKIKIRITFKMGDYTLAPHMFVLLPFDHQSLKIKNVFGELKKGDILGKGCVGLWNPDREDILNIVESLSHASEGHREDLIKLIES